jgi:hypothetical protein
MFVLTKPAVFTTNAFLLAEVDKRLAPLAYETEEEEGGRTYRISGFGLGSRYSMFGAFREASLRREGDLWVLRLSEGRPLLPGFAMAAVGLAVSGLSGRLDLQGALLLLIAPPAFFGLIHLDYRRRVSAWWRML